MDEYGKCTADAAASEGVMWLARVSASSGPARAPSGGLWLQPRTNLQLGIPQKGRCNSSVIII